MRVSPKCPVCYRRTVRTINGNVGWHCDQAGHNCPMSGQPYPSKARAK